LQYEAEEETRRTDPGEMLQVFLEDIVFDHPSQVLLADMVDWNILRRSPNVRSVMTTAGPACWNGQRRILRRRLGYS